MDFKFLNKASLKNHFLRLKFKMNTMLHEVTFLDHMFTFFFVVRFFIAETRPFNRGTHLHRSYKCVLDLDAASSLHH